MGKKSEEECKEEKKKQLFFFKKNNPKTYGYALLDLMLLSLYNILFQHFWWYTAHRGLQKYIKAIILK